MVWPEQHAQGWRSGSPRVDFYEEKELRYVRVQERDCGICKKSHLGEAFILGLEYMTPMQCRANDMGFCAF